MYDAEIGLMDPFKTIGSKNATAHPNPYYQFSQVFTPRRLKDLFKWCEFLFYNSPHIYAALRKFGEYPITNITYNTTNDAIKEKHEYLLEQVIRARELLIKATLDKYVYGNAFISMYQPFIRFLKCPKCGILRNIEGIDYKFSVRKLHFTYNCAACNSSVTATTANIVDKKLMLSRKVNFIRWDPKLMDIDFNPITGNSEYYYTIPQDVIQKINAGHKSLIDTLPLGFLEAVKSNQKFKFNQNAMMHLKVGGPAGISPQWGLPPLLSVISQFHYTAVLRKANEAIALDHLVPFRVIHPAQASGSGDPLISMNLTRWRDSLKTNLKQWRLDPLHMMISPIPLGLTQVGGQGRALLTLGEIQESEKSIVAALGIPIEFLYGGLTGQGMEATLRLIENQLETHINDLLDLLQWIDDKCASFLGWEKIEVGMTKFRMIDDKTNKQVILNLWMSGMQGNPKVISNATIAEMHDIDLKAEQQKIKQEAIDDVRDQQELQKTIEQIQSSLAEQVQMEAAQATGSGVSYNQQQIIGQADQLVQQLLGVPEGERKSMLHQLQMEDLVMYSVVIQRLEQAQQNMRRQIPQ